MTVAVPQQQSQPKVGMYTGLSRAEYESIPAINVSTLENFERSAAHGREAMRHPKEPTGAMDFGTALHCAVLEPMRFANSYVAGVKVDRRTKIGKETWSAFEAENAGKEVLDADEFVAIQKMRESAWAQPTAQQILSSKGFNEVCLVWIDEETGEVCKGLIDRLGALDSWSVVADVKTCQDASRHGFKQACRKFNYGAKAAFYLDGCNAVRPRDRRFAWIAIEKEPPYAVAVYEADDSAISAGRSKYKRWLRNYADAKRTNVWPGYPTEAQALTADDTEWSS